MIEIENVMKRIEDTKDLDLPALSPTLHLSLSKVGTTARLIPIKLRDPKSGQVSVHMCGVELYTTLPGQRRGIHMSRFGRILQAASEDEYESLQELAVRLAGDSAEHQEVQSATVVVRAPWVVEVKTPVTEMPTKKAYQVAIEATSGPSGVNVRLGVTVSIILACPCVQLNLENELRGQILDLGISEADYDRILTVLPIASHSQRGKAEVWLEDRQMKLTPQMVIDATEEVVSVTYDMLRRPDEVEVVRAAHLHPQFCEDATRAIGANLYKHFGRRLAPETKVFVRVTSEESIHSYDIVSELDARLAELNVAAA
jgi:GTP cyclohydrolase-4